MRSAILHQLSSLSPAFGIKPDRLLPCPSSRTAALFFNRSLVIHTFKLSWHLQETEKFRCFARCSDKKERSKHLHKHIGHASRYTGKGGKKCGKCKKINVSAYKLLSELCKETLGDGVKTAAIAKFHKFAGVKTAAKYLKILTFAMKLYKKAVLESKKKVVPNKALVFAEVFSKRARDHFISLKIGNEENKNLIA
ncbi:hypothetical protein IEQ34_021415 [Dendrobium chrysotoxum]|uniref:Uncharacterized protein n=1 Tax=Dendrobium chrysotoxum TaxID=161865 RepID=A0AAV7G5T4_DENCH|nr:hypothetical protein IEQ34_021415 [Dendrobium chrysotoxum]